MVALGLLGRCFVVGEVEVEVGGGFQVGGNTDTLWQR